MRQIEAHSLKRLAQDAYIPCSLSRLEVELKAGSHQSRLERKEGQEMGVQTESYHALALSARIMHSIPLPCKKKVRALP